MRSRTLFISLASVGTIVTVSAPATVALMDHISSLKQELQVYQTAHAVDFSDLVDKLSVMTGPLFHDVFEADWFYPFVTSVAEWGVVSGYKDVQGNSTGEYGPQKAVTVAEALKMAMNAAQAPVEEFEGAASDPVARAHWAAHYVAYAEHVGVRVLKGPLDLNRPATRAEVIAIVDDAFGDNVPAIYSTFQDVAGHAYESDIAYAAARRIVSGDKDNKGNPLHRFRPNDGVNRAEIAKIIYQRVKLQVREEASRDNENT